MTFKFFSRNGNILPVEAAQVPLSNIEYSYGFGVYESIRVSNKVVYFIDDHTLRLLESARIIGLNHTFTGEAVSNAIAELLAKNGAETCNVKILLIGGKTAEEAQLNILCMNPLFPDKKLYRDGVACVTYEYGRPFPHAKTLNMLQSYLAYRTAKEAGAYDSLLIDTQGRITEGTRTNFFCIKGKTLFSPNEGDILPGITRKAVLKVAADNGFDVVQKDIRPADLGGYDGAFLTSTSAKILPIRSVDSYRFSGQPQALKELMEAFDVFLNQCGGKL
ncbi:MAG: aminotransferase class IV [bacterium]|nr:aminotransferase class IV [bacterium]